MSIDLVTLFKSIWSRTCFNRTCVPHSSAGFPGHFPRAAHFDRGRGSDHLAQLPRQLSPQPAVRLDHPGSGGFRHHCNIWGFQHGMQTKQSSTLFKICHKFCLTRYIFVLTYLDLTLKLTELLLSMVNSSISIPHSSNRTYVILGFILTHKYFTGYEYERGASCSYLPIPWAWQDPSLSTEYSRCEKPSHLLASLC